jgi:hypothetical protein
MDKPPSVDTSEQTDSNHHVGPDTPPYPYVISTNKLMVLSMATGGLYNIHWFYKQWRSFNKNDRNGVILYLAAIFSIFSSWSLFRTIAKDAQTVDRVSNMNASALSLAFLVIVLAMNRLPEPYYVIAGLSGLPLIPVQRTINSYWELRYGNNLDRSKFGISNYMWTCIGCVILILVILRPF